MKVDFPSASFFEALNARMVQEQDRFTRLGYFDTTFGVTVVGPGEQRRNYLLNFEVYECMGAREIDNLEGEDPDFVLEADLLQTGRQYGHRDLCLFFGFVSPIRGQRRHPLARSRPPCGSRPVRAASGSD